MKIHLPLLPDEEQALALLAQGHSVTDISKLMNIPRSTAVGILRRAEVKAARLNATPKANKLHALAIKAGLIPDPAKS